jgi:glycine cleavage system aminomethyltransferase T
MHLEDDEALDCDWKGIMTVNDVILRIAFEPRVRTSPYFEATLRFSVERMTIGRVTRCAYSPRLEKKIGSANVPVERAGIGTRFLVETPQGQAGATVVPKPFFDSRR